MSFFVWNSCIDYVSKLLLSSPEELFGDAWNVVTGGGSADGILLWFIGAGCALVNVFFLIGFLRQTTNLKEAMTTETAIEALIKVVIADALIANIQPAAESLIDLSITVTSAVMFGDLSTLHFSDPSLDLTTVLSDAASFGMMPLMLFVLQFVCVVMIIVTVLKRVAVLLFSLCAMPIGAALLAGGREMEQTGWASIRLFLTYCFQPVLIGFFLRIGALMANGINYQDVLNKNGATGFGEAANSITIMLFVTVLVRGSDDLLKRAFDLR